MKRQDSRRLSRPTTPMLCQTEHGASNLADPRRIHGKNSAPVAKGRVPARSTGSPLMLPSVRRSISTTYGLHAEGKIKSESELTSELEAVPTGVRKAFLKESF